MAIIVARCSRVYSVTETEERVLLLICRVNLAKEFYFKVVLRPRGLRFMSGLLRQSRKYQAHSRYRMQLAVLITNDHFVAMLYVNPFQC
jgi:hypothetical protein